MSNRAAEPWVDWGKAIAAQCIVWHHLVHYGPLAPRLRPWAPRVVDWLDQRALLAVQVFLVMAGYLAARSLWPSPGVPRVAPRDWGARVAQRWRRLAPPYLVAIVLAVLAAAWARHGMADADTPAAPTWAQLAANLTLTHDVVGQPALSAGLWYVAIDLQLFALLAALAALLAAVRPVPLAPPLPRWRGRLRMRPLAPAAALPRVDGGQLLGVALLSGAALASVCVFNLQAGADEWAPYFFGSYALGVLAAWGATGAGGARRLCWSALLLTLAGAGLWIAWRDRLALAVLAALVLLWQPARTWLAQRRVQPAVAWLATLSYALFLVHYPVSLAVNTAFERWLPHTPGMAAAGLITAWLASLAAAWLAWHVLERPRGPAQRRAPALNAWKQAA
ncbi:acyltransferase family protein [Ottowia testudinis]|uniref:Acyltransferase family protein n=1 Tax=Ottowia testudinis TaxID=2816950 RepID=A0A975H3M5_9BURK|nr:acyltransferase family protein [Ottowia testudinis]QTD45435.1 acyltransferase family protein [Ottowia testudinis]